VALRERADFPEELFLAAPIAGVMAVSREIASKADKKNLMDR